jgi:bifunctional non-homologous end joining protein LigD
MVWDVGTWEPQGDVHEMLRKGDLKFRLNGQKLKGDFALVHIKSRRPDGKGTEWLLIKHRDAYDQPGYDIDKYDYSVLTKRSLKQIAGDEGSAAWESSRKASTRGGSSKNDWLADSIAKADAKKAKATKKSASAKAAPIATKSTAKRALAKTVSAVKKNSTLKLKKKA